MKKDLSYYLNLNYHFTIAPDIDEGKIYYVAEHPDLPGCGAHGETIADAIKSLEESKELWIETSLEKGMQIPEPTEKAKCKKCKYLMELLKRTPMTNRDYWIMTELFVWLHGGDVCRG